jgi:hypothetical protein
VILLGRCVGFVSVHLFMLISHLLYFLFPLWVLRGVTLISMIQCGLMFLPFSLTNGLYLAEIFTISLDSSDISTFVNFNSDQIVLVAQTRSKNLFLPELFVLPVPINLPTSVESDPSLPAASDIVSPIFTLPEPSSSISFSS